MFWLSLSIDATQIVAEKQDAKTIADLGFHPELYKFLHLC